MLPGLFLWEASGNLINPYLCRGQIKKEEEGEIEQFRAAQAVETWILSKCLNFGESFQLPEPRFCHLSNRTDHHAIRIKGGLKETKQVKNDLA